MKEIFVLIVDLCLLLAYLIVYLLVACLIPVWLGIRYAKKNGFSPHWMWFGIVPPFGWMAYAAMFCYPIRLTCPRFESYCTPKNGSGPYKIELNDNESVVANLVPDDVQELYDQRGQVAAITDRRLLFIQPRPPQSSWQYEWKSDKFYSIESIELSEIREVSQKTTADLAYALGGVLFSIIGCSSAYSWLTGKLNEPGIVATVAMPTIFIAFGMILILGVKRRVLTVIMDIWVFNWRSRDVAYMLLGVLSLIVGFSGAYLELTGQLIGPGRFSTVMIPIIFLSSGIRLLRGVKRRVLTFRADDWVFNWRSGPLEYRKSKIQVDKIRDEFLKHRIMLTGLSE